METQSRLSTRMIAISIIWIIIFAFGVLLGAVGPSLQELAVNNNTTPAQLGLITTLSFIGGLFVQAVVSRLIDRVGPTPLMVVAAALVAIGTFGFTFGQVLILTLVFAFIAGIGHGLLDTSAQVLAALLFVKNRVRILNSVHLAFGVGALVGPAIAGWTLSVWQTALPALWFGGAICAVSVPVLMILARTQHTTAPSSDEAQSAMPVNGTSIYRSPLLWAFGVLILFYVGAELGLGNWTSLYLQQSAEYTKQDGASIVSGYWLAFTVGRVIATAIGARIKPNVILIISLAGCIAGGLLFVFSVGNGGLTVVATLIMGFFFGPIYPTVVAVATSVFHEAPGRATSLIVAMGSIGGAILPWLQGVVLERISNNANTVYMFAAILAITAAYIAAKFAERSREQVVLELA